jgi:hypothetical protein
VPNGIRYLELPAGTRLGILTTRGAEIEILTLEERPSDSFASGSRRHPMLGDVQYVAVLKAPLPFDGPAIMLAGQLGGKDAERDIDIMAAATDELTPGVTLLLGRRQLVVAEVYVIASPVS